MHELLNQLKAIKLDLKELRSELNDKLPEDTQFNEFSEDMKASREVLNSYRNKLITETPALGAIVKRITDSKLQLKVVKQSIRDSIMVVDRVTSEQLTIDLKF